MVHQILQPSPSFITNNPAAPPDSAYSALVMKSQSPRIDKAIKPDNCKTRKKIIYTKLGRYNTNNYKTYGFNRT